MAQVVQAQHASWAGRPRPVWRPQPRLEAQDAAVEAHHRPRAEMQTSAKPRSKPNHSASATAMAKATRQRGTPHCCLNAGWFSAEIINGLPPLTDRLHTAPLHELGDDDDGVAQAETACAQQLLPPLSPARLPRRSTTAHLPECAPRCQPAAWQHAPRFAVAGHAIHARRTADSRKGEQVSSAALWKVSLRVPQ